MRTTSSASRMITSGVDGSRGDDVGGPVLRVNDLSRAALWERAYLQALTRWPFARKG